MVSKNENYTKDGFSIETSDNVIYNKDTHENVPYMDIEDAFNKAKLMNQNTKRISEIADEINNIKD
ncbi:MAG: hypothetical protein GY793_08335 [Proteobacteria bacterium]|nr:hypothetical protein [Pseudomonadota bacterium]